MKNTSNKPERVEVAIERESHDEAFFVIYKEDTNREKYRSRIYTRRQNAIRGANRYAKKNNMKVVRWLK